MKYHPHRSKKSLQKALCAIAILLVSANTAKAQDPLFTQFYANPLYLNPAFTGSNNCPRLVMNYRNQWPALSGTFVTYSASYDQGVPELSGGLGLLVTADDAANGTLKTTTISGMYAYHQNITRKFAIRFGAQATYMQKSLDWDKLSFGDEIDPRYGFVFNTNEVRRGGSSSNVDFSAGILGFSKSFYIGFAAHHLTEPNESLIAGDSKLPMKLTGHLGSMIPLDGPHGDVFISPNVLYQQQGAFGQLNLGLYVQKGPLVGGIWYRNKDAFITLVGVQTKNFKFGYSYDVTISKLANASAGSHEISMQLLFPCKKRRPRFRTIDCPSF